MDQNAAQVLEHVIAFFPRLILLDCVIGGLVTVPLSFCL